MVCKGVRVEEVPCKEGETKCENSDLYQCKEGKWVLVEKNSPQCIPPIPLEAIALAGAVIIGVGALAYYLTRR